MTPLARICSIFFLSFFGCFRSVCSQNSVAVSVAINNQNFISISSLDYVSFNFDWHKDSEEYPAWVGASIQAIDFNNPFLRQAASALSPGKLRIGGSEEDEVVYDVDGKGCGSVDPAFCLNMTRWKQIVQFCEDMKIKLVFGLNGMSGRANSTSPMDLSNQEALLNYTAFNQLPVYGFEMGNELSSSVDPTVLGQDFLRLATLLEKYWPDATIRPKLIGPDINPNTNFMNSFLSVVSARIDVVTYHNYVGYGLDTNLSAEVVTTTFLDQGLKNAQPMIDAYKKYAAPHGAQIWVGEIAAAWHSGQDNVTDAFESSFWYADALGVLASNNHTGFCRQTMYGGWYGLLNRTNWHPNPDFYVAKLWHDLMNVGVLSVQVSSADPSYNKTLRAYSQCARTGGLMLVLINIDSKFTFNVKVSSPTIVGTRSEYVLSATNLSARLVFLNGKGPLDVNNVTGALPLLSPVIVTNSVDSISITPYTIGFYQFVNISCGPLS